MVVDGIFGVNWPGKGNFCQEGQELLLFQFCASEEKWLNLIWTRYSFILFMLQDRRMRSKFKIQDSSTDIDFYS